MRHVFRRGGETCLRGFGWEARRRRWEDNIKMDLREIGIDGVNWIGLKRAKCSRRIQWYLLL
jgi:hypothetical protein